MPRRPGAATLLAMALRILFTATPQAGHLRPLLPLAVEFAAAGHDVVVATGAGPAELVREAGLEHRAVGPELGEWFARLAARTRGRPGEGLAPHRVEPYFIPRLFAEVGLAAVADELDELVTTWRPDLIVYEPYSLAAPMVAAAHDVPAVEHGIGLPFTAEVAQLVEDAVTPAWAAAGLPAPGPSPARLRVDVCPPSLAPPGGAAAASPAARQPLRPVPLPAGQPLPVSLPFPDRPLVYATLGTFANADLPLFGLILQALATLPVNVLVTAGDDEVAAAIGEPPANAVICGFVPQAAVLPSCAAVVHHAGAGTTFGVLAHGLPSLALPQSADNFRIAASLGAAGAARVLGPGDVTVESIRAGLADVLASPAYGRAAQRIAGEIAAMPAPADVLPALTALSAHTREDHP